MPYLTERLVADTAPRPRDFFLWDTEVRGFGVKLSRTGRKSFVLQWRGEAPNQTHRRKLADVDEIGVDKARELAAQLKAELAGKALAARPAEARPDASKPGAAEPGAAEDEAPGALDYSPQDVSNWLDGTVEFSGKGMRSRASVTRNQILDAACLAFLDQGYDANLDQIAADAGVAKPTIYKYFGDKHGLFRQTIAEMIRRVTPGIVVPSDAGIRETMQTVGMAFLKVLVSEPSLSFFRLAIGDMRQFPELNEEAHRRVTVGLTRLLADYIRTLIASGAVRPVDADAIAEAFLTAVVGFARTRRLLGVNDRAEADELRYAETVIDFFVAGLEPD